MRKITLLVVLVLPILLHAQTIYTKKLSAGINRSNVKNEMPVLSGDGRYMVLLSDLEKTGGKKLYYAKKSGSRWGEPQAMPKSIDLSATNAVGGYSLSLDGKTFVFTSRRRGSVGKFDIWFSKKSGNIFGAPTNPGAVLNTASNETDPYLSPDGQELYFCQCANMTQTTASGCKIMVAKKKGSSFGDAKPLPSPINTGNELAPMILADNETLIFASSRSGGKGKLDLYMSRKTATGWSKPVNMTFLNTANDDRYISIPMKGDKVFFSKPEGMASNIVYGMIPKEFRQKNIVWLNGTIENYSSTGVLKPKVIVKNLKTNKKTLHSIDAKGKFSVFLAEGADYDVAVLDPNFNSFFDSKMMHLNTIEKTKREAWKVNLRPIAKNAKFELHGVEFEENSSYLSTTSSSDLDRVKLILKNNPSLNLEVGVHMKEFRKDSVKSSPDLTELILDTILVKKEIEKEVQVMVAVPDTSVSDSISTDEFKVDSVLQTKIVKEIVEVNKVKRTYHNDRTQKQAEAVEKYLTAKGVPANRIKAKGYRDRNKSMFTTTDEHSEKVEVKFY